MNSKNKIRLGWLAFVFVVFHCSFLFIYAAPEKLMPKAAKNFVAPYVSPVFAQEWSMFAPCPLIESSLKMKIYYKDDSLDWFSPAAEALAIHSYARVTHHGELALIESNILHWIYRDVVEFGLKYDEPIPETVRGIFHEGYSYNIVKRYIYANSMKINGVRPVSAHVVCDFYNVKDRVGGEIALPVFKWSTK